MLDGSGAEGGGWILLILAGLLGGGIFGLRSSEEDAALEHDISATLAAASDDLEVNVSWGRVTLSGTVGSRQLQERTLWKVTSLPGVRQVADRTEVVEPRLRQPRFTLVFMADGGLTIEGVLASDEKRIWGDAAGSLGKIAYSDLRGAPEMAALGDPGMLRSALVEVGSIPGLEIFVAPGRISLQGELPSAEIQHRLVQTIRDRLSDEWELSDRTRFRRPQRGIAAAEQDLAELLEGLKIDFDRGTYQLTPMSQLPIDRVAVFLKTHPNLRLEIAAAEEKSRPGSGKRRADAVYFSLMKSGIPSMSLMSRKLEQGRPETGVVRFRVHPR